MSKKREMNLIEGEVLLRVRVSTLIKPEDWNNEERIEERLLDLAMDNISSCETEVEIDNDVPVEVSEETAKKYYYKLVDRQEWREIVKESKGV